MLSIEFFFNPGWSKSTSTASEEAACQTVISEEKEHEIVIAMRGLSDEDFYNFSQLKG